MKLVSAANKAKLLTGATTFVHCGRIETAGGIVYGFTEHNASLVVAGETYYPGLLSASTVEHGYSLTVANVQVSGPYADTITRASVDRGVFENASVRLFLVDYLVPADGTIELIVGTVADQEYGEFGYTFQFDDLRNKLGRIITRKLLPICDAVFGDSRCTLNAATYTVAGAITTVTSQRTLVASALIQADGYFTGGVITMTSGPASGYSADVKTHAADTFYLHRVLPFDVAVSNTFTAVAGCAKTLLACQGYANVVNFRGFPYVPGTDQYLRRLPL